MKLETLYKRTKTKAIQFWQIEVIDATPANNGWGIVKTSGQLGTVSPTTHRETITQGKNIGKANETTPYEQACSQAKSDWQKKRDEGYKSLTDLNAIVVQANPVTAQDVQQISNENLAKCLQEWLPEFNDDASGNVKPMLATDWTKVKFIIYPCYIQPKLDGVRCLMIVSVLNQLGATSSVRYLSRSGKDYNTLNHITASCNFPEGIYILDGEVYSDELSFQEITAAVKKQCPDSLKLKFRCYDIVDTNQTQNERIIAASDLVRGLKSDYIQFVPTMIASSKEMVQKAHDEWVQEGYEGAMIRFIEGRYTPGQRSRELLKVKQFDETEFEFIRWEKGQRDEDLLAVCRTSATADIDYPEGALFKAKMVGTKEHKKQMETTTGKLLTVKHFGLTEGNKSLGVPKGIPRFPIGKGFRLKEDI